VEAFWVGDGDAPRASFDNARLPQFPEGPGHHLAHRSDGIGELLIG
jgi:hypothetical protein